MSIFRPQPAPQVIRPPGPAALLPVTIGPALPAGDSWAQMQALASLRRPNDPQVIAYGIAATLPVVTGTVPVGGTAVSQALAAYRGPVTTQYPAVPRALPAAAASLTPPVGAAQAVVQPWAYAALEQWRLGAEPAPFAGIAAIYLGPKYPQQPAAQPWPYAAAQPVLEAPIAAPAARTPLVPATQAAVLLWPYAQTEQWRLGAEPAPFFGITQVYLAPPAVPQPLGQAWPYSQAQLALQGPITAPAAYVSPAVVPQVPATPWPYATQMAQPGSGTFATTQVYLAPAPLPMVPLQPWPYAAMQRAPLAPLGGIAAVYAGAPPVVIAPAPAPWPYSAVATLPRNFTAGGVASTFEIGNPRSWQPALRARTWLISLRARFWTAPARARAWRVTAWKVGSHMSTNEKRLSETVLYDFDCSLLLAVGETISGTPAVTAEPTTSPTLSIGTPAVNTQPITYADGHTAPIGQVIQVRIGAGAIATGQLAQTYLMRAKFATSLNPNVEANGYLRVNDTPAA